MDSVFKKYNVYEDVADIIAREVHKGNLQEITNKIKRIKIMNDFKSFVGELYVMDYKDEFCEDEGDTIINFTDMLIDTFVDYKLESKDISDEIILHGGSWTNDINIYKNSIFFRNENDRYQQSSDEIILHGVSWMNDINIHKNRIHDESNENDRYQQSCIYGYMNYLQEVEYEFMSKVYDNFFEDIYQD